MQSPAPLDDKHCSGCATLLEPKDVAGKSRPVCPECGRVVYYDPKVAATCIVERDGKVLMICRALQPGIGLWSMPGGYVDRGEVVEEAAAREVLEETGLEVEVEHLVGLFSERDHPVMVAAFAARETGGVLKAGEEAQEVGFFPLDGLPELAFPRDEQILSRWRVQRDGKEGLRGMKTLLSKVSSSALDLLFPIPCAGCGREGELICQECVPELAGLTSPYCAKCASPDTLSPCRWCRENPLDADGIRAPFLMEGTITQAIHSFKYRGVRAAAPELGRLLAGYLAKRPLPGDVVVPVPLHPRRLRNRGYNQSALLARELAKATGLALARNVLARIKDAPPQVDAASRSQRRTNVESSFQCTGEVTGQKVILVDDVATTGSTLSACAASLKAAGADSVWGLVLAREK